MKIVRKILSFALTLSLLLSVMAFPANASGASDSGGTLTVSMSNKNPKAGEEIVVTLSIAGQQNLAGLGIFIYYNSSFITCEKKDINQRGIAWLGYASTANNPDDSTSTKDDAHQESYWKKAHLNYISEEALTGTGVIGTVTFHVKSDMESVSSPIDVCIEKSLDTSSPAKPLTTTLAGDVGDNATINIQGVAPTINMVALQKSASDTAAVSSVNVEGEGGQDQTFQAKATSAQGNDITEKVTWSVENPTGGKGVKIDAKGQITVEPTAAEGTYTIKAAKKDGASLESATGPVTAELKVTRATATLTGISLSPTSVTVNGTTGGTVTATATDQFGEKINGVQWTVTPKTEGVTSENSGVKVSDAGDTILVDAKAKEGTYEVTGTYVDAQTASVMAVLNEENEPAKATLVVKRETPKAAEITISGSAADVTVPTGDTAAEATFTVSMKDQYGDAYTSDAVSWSVTEAAGVSISAGKLTVTKDAKAFATDVTGKKVTITASCDETTAETPVEVTIKRATPVATSVKIFKDSTAVGEIDTVVIPPESLNKDNTYQYTGKVFDQYGTEMSDTVSFSASELPANASFSTDTLTVKSTTPVGQKGKITASATVGGKTVTATTELNFVDVAVKQWPTVTTKEAVYGTTNSEIIGTLPASGEATVGTGTTLTGKFSVSEPTACLTVGDAQIVTVIFTVDNDQGYNGTTISNNYKVKITPKPVTVVADKQTITYGQEPAGFTWTLKSGSSLVPDTDLGLKLKAEGDPMPTNVGTYNVIKDTVTNNNYDVTVEGTGAFVINPAPITGFVQENPVAAQIYANDANNTTERLKNAVSLPEKVTIKYGDNKTQEDVEMEWVMNPAAVTNFKEGTYTFTGTPKLGNNFTNPNNAQALTTTVTVKKVNGTIAIVDGTSATKAFADVTADGATWTSLGMPTQVTVTYDSESGAESTTHTIGDWSPNLAALKSAAVGSEDVKRDLTPSLALTEGNAYPAWATMGAAPTFALTLTPKYPGKVTVTAPAGVTYGTALGAPSATYTVNAGYPALTETAKFTYTYTGTALDGTMWNSIEKPTKAGTYKVTAVLDSATHSGEGDSTEFTISPKALTDSMLSLPADATYTYNKAPHTPTVTVTDADLDNTVLAANTDYTVAYTSNTNAGTATVTVTGKGNYTGTASTTFEIAKASITGLKPIISGTPEAGYVLTASLEGVAAGELAWTWNVGGTTSTNVSYTIQPADSNKDITVTATATATGNYTGTSLASEKVTVQPVRITGTVTITGTGTGENGALKGSNPLTADVSKIQPTEAQESLTYQWYRDNTPIEGATEKTYTGADGDTGSITVKVTAGTDFAGDLTSKAVELGKAVLTGSVSISGAAAVDQLLTAVVSVGDVDAANYTVVWLRNGTEIPGATGTTYTVTKADQGTTITAKVTAVGDTYTGELVSNATAISAAAPDAPTVTATAGDGQVTVTWTTPDGNGAPVTEYTVTCSPAGTSPSTVTLPVGTNSHTFTGLTNGTTYTFNVTAANSVGNSAPGTASAAPAAPAVEPDPGTNPPAPPPVLVDPGPGAGGTGTGTGTTTTTTPTDPNEPVTTTTTDASGNVTTTTAYPDGGTTTVEQKADGTTIVTDVDSQGNTSSKISNPDGSSMSTVQNVDGSSSIVTTDASGKTNAIVDLPAGTVNAANSSNTPAALPMDDVYATRDPETAPVVVVNTANEQPVKVEIPVANANTGTVAVLVKADGTEEIIKTTVPTQDGIAVTVNSGDTVKIVDNSKAFADTASHWGADAVNFVASRELFNGTSDAKFSPDDNMTRGMLMTVLARFENVDTSGGSVWYEKGVAWAVTQGLSDGTNPNGQITREQLATILYRFAQSKGADTTVKGSLDRFPDAGKVSGWAREAMSWAVGSGIISGVGGVTLDPGGNATRAQVATMLMRYAEKFSA